ncbi:cell division control protein 6 homolog [Anopheles maculipalpis]|uniref:cell division control protein 6 homolog n=1 Tax=Anopheles maculipalpis TaxID=1496333 RepID=UPI00215915EB|nr:cell division control protein 6 homolog [Anopheles maculipalpis]
MHRRTRLSLRSTSINDKENENEQTQLQTSARKRRSTRVPPVAKEEDSEEELAVHSPKKAARKPGRSRPSIVLHGEELENESKVAPDANGKLPEREKEYDELVAYVENVLSSNGSGSLYISGPPGTGKTATLQRILNYPPFVKKLKPVYINCTSIKSVGSIYKKISEELDLRVSGTTEKLYQAAIETHLERKHKTIMLVLDEIDQLSSSKQTILYSIFEWPARPTARLILIGIANALDLTDRLLARLQARCELKPHLIQFLPYTKQQIVAILKASLAETDSLSRFPEAALGLLAAKVASTSGDIRRALFIARRLVESAKKEDRTTKSDTPTVVSMGQVMTVLKQVYGASQTLSNDLEEGFPLQQKLLICSLMLLLKHGKNKDITVGKLHDVYKTICTKRNIQAVDQTEFISLCTLVETRGIMRLQGKKEPRMHRVCLQWDEEEVSTALNDKQLIASIISDVSCLAK